MKKLGDIISAIVVILLGAFMLYMGIYTILSGVDYSTKFLGLPFILIAISILINGISIILNKEIELYDIVSKNIYVLGFLIIWFGFLISYEINLFSNWNRNSIHMFIFSIPFWFIGIYIIIKKGK